ncbi:guanine-1-methyltransferase-domain-containing protein [Cokeromyces recurvatus]|uniref:guanine-1-methyltransferase-domain-containing protein n=1 Tax=Cokeromyces recurvatus TaxID=90255 RepID=UPI00221F69D3|nr:guanine-1-methyltransferase-domain-containing protein [Cokeromyces recurvatus]KAI7903683.1 guanine-1-methyltransferase-domain-containing protein [Cokeromyces recurvatus]
MTDLPDSSPSTSNKIVPNNENINSSEKSNIRVFMGKQYDITDPRFKGLSKNAIKKILKDEIWEETKPMRNKEKREKYKRKRAERQKLESQGLLERLPKRPKAKNMIIGQIGIIIDCSYSSYMIDKELSSLRQQIVRCYSANVRAQKESFNMMLTSFDEALKKQMDAKAPSWQNWKNIKITNESYLDVMGEDQKENLVYLTADSKHVAHELEEGKTYIIGGIVDKNRYKNLCYEKAESQGIKTAQLPIGDYIHMASRKVLTVNQVMEIMVKWLDCRDWEQAFKEVIPERKLKDSTFINQHNSSNNNSDVESENAHDVVNNENGTPEDKEEIQEEMNTLEDKNTSTLEVQEENND